MRISELSQRSGVPVATIKFYLRERLLPEGVLTSATQAQYDEEHLSRLRLIRALLGAGSLSIAQTRAVLSAAEDPPGDSVHDLLGLATDATARPISAGDHERVHDFLRAWGWTIDEKDCATHDRLEEAMRGLDAADFPLRPTDLDHYRDHIWAIAEHEVAGVPVDSAVEAVRYVVLGTVLMEPFLLALRRMAHQEASNRRFGPRP